MPLKRLTKPFSNLAAIAFDKAGDRNPQLLREWQGRLCWRNLLLTGLLSLAVQGLLLLQRLARLPYGQSSYSQYCLYSLDDFGNPTNCQVGASGQPLINWPFVWADVFQDVSFVLVWALIVGGVYLLTADLSKEARRGTLNFLRMSPLSGRRILLGKLLGVPVLLYLGIGAMLPLHLSMGLMSGYPVGIVLAFYGLLGAIAACFYAAALWFALLTKGLQGLQTWLISGLSAGLLLLGWELRHANMSTDWFRLFNPLHILADWTVRGLGQNLIWPFDQGSDLNGFRKLGWFFAPVGSHRGWLMMFALANALGLGLWFWVALERKFQMPANTALGKQQSYGLTLYLSMIVMGFNLQKISHSASTNSLSDVFWSYLTSMMIWGVVLMFLLLPSKQILLDWARYRHQPSGQSSQQQFQQRPRRRYSLIIDLLYHDASPSSFAFAINLGIIAGVLLLGIGIYAAHGPTMGAENIFLRWCFCAAVLLICSLVIQGIALSNLLHWRWLAVGAVAAIVLGWPSVLLMVGVNSYQSPFGSLWLTTAFALFENSTIATFSSSGVGFAIATHLTLIATLSGFLARRCQILGQSELKALMADGGDRTRSQA